MTKTELITHIQVHTGLSNAAATRFMHITLLTITQTLKKGEDVVLIDFGTFRTVKRPARMAVNPHTQAAIKIKAKTVPKFSPGKGLRDAVK